MLGIAQTATNRFLRNIAGWLAEQVPGDELPEEVLGCGSYGCVYATSKRDERGERPLVVKVTTDPTEVNFVEAAMTLPWPEGIVRYYRILAAQQQTFRSRPVYLIWRETAFNVGEVLHYREWRMTWEDKDKKAAFRRLRQFKAAASLLRKSLQNVKDPHGLLCSAKALEQWAFEEVAEFDLDRRSVDGPEEQIHRAVGDKYYPRLTGPLLRGRYRVAYLYRLCGVIAEFMANEPVLDQVGSAFGEYLDAGLLLADVHAGNIGNVSRGGYTQTVITDPGHAVDLRKIREC